MKARIAAGEVPLVGVGRGPRPPPRRPPLRQPRRRRDLPRRHRSRAEGRASATAPPSPRSPRSKGKSVDGLKDALVAAAKADLADAVEDGRLTAAQQAKIVADLPDRIDDLVNGELGHKRFGRGPGFGGPSFGGPPSTASGGRRLADPLLPRPAIPRAGAVESLSKGHQCALPSNVPGRCSPRR